MPIGLQELIHKMEEGEGARFLKLLVVFLGLIFVAVLYSYGLPVIRGLGGEYKSFNTPEAMDAAQLARNISRAKGFTTEYIRPLSAYLIQKKQGAPKLALQGDHPDLANAPFYPLVLAGWMKVIPFRFEAEAPKDITFWRYQPEFWIAVLNHLFFFSALVIMFKLAKRLFDAAVAWLTVILMAGTELFWRYALSGLSTWLVVVIFLSLTAVLVAVEQNAREEKRSGRWLFWVSVAAGALTGLAGLTRYSFGWMIVPVLIFLGVVTGKQRRPALLGAGVAFLVVMGPWLARNYHWSGRLFGTAGYAALEQTPSFPEHRLERYVSRDFEVALGKVEATDYVRKLVVNTADILQNDLPKLGGTWMTAFFLVGLLIPFRNPGLGRLRYFVLGSLVLLIGVQALGRTHLTRASPGLTSENLLVVLAPLAVMFGVGLFYILLDQIAFPAPQLRQGFILLTSVVISAPLVFALMPPRSSPVSYPPYYPPWIQELGKLLGPEELMMSDMPWAVAWYADRPCLDLTLDAPLDMKESVKSDFFNIHDFQHAISALYLTQLTMEKRPVPDILRSKDLGWDKFFLDVLVRKNVIKGFPLKESLNEFWPEQLFLTDRARWKTASK